jgi:hypothetical protein
MQLQLFVLPPGRPRLNDCVEGPPRTHTEELWGLCTADTDPASQRSELHVWEHAYNQIRPHHALACLAPDEFPAISDWEGCSERTDRAESVARQRRTLLEYRAASGPRRTPGS